MDTTIQNELEIRSNIIIENNYKRIAKETLEIISDTLSKSLGYYGSNTILEDKAFGHVITKDGYTILNKIKFNNTTSTTILEIIKNISRDLVREVGDGSTSSIVIADNLFKAINESEIIKKYPMKIILESLDEIQEAIIKGMDNYSTPITDENFDIVRKIATISNNNDAKIGGMIHDIYKQIGHEGFIYIEKSHTEEDYYEIVDGIELGRGYISPDFANQANKRECILQEPFILLCNDRLDSTDLNLLLDVVGNLMAQHGKPVVIIAKSFSVEFVSCWQINIRENKRAGKELPICLIDYSFANNNAYETFDDLATYVGAIVYNKRDGETPDNFLQILGGCDKIIVNDNSTKIIGRKGKDEDIENRIQYINTYIEDLKNEEGFKDVSSQLYFMQKRVANLKGKIVKFYVGGATDIEKENKKFLIEDSIFAVKSAMKYGYVAGGNLTIPRIFKDTIEISCNDDTEFKYVLYEELKKLIENAFIECYAKVLRNSDLFDNDEAILETIDSCLENETIFNLKTRKFESIKDTDIINSSRTETMILKSAISIIGLLATSNQFIKTNINII